MEIQKVMYGLPQLGLLAQELLEERVAKNRDTQNKLMMGMQKHHTRLVEFCLIIDDFKVNYVGKGQTEHLK